MDNRRTETAREHDDSEIIEDRVPASDQQGRSGGNLQRDIGTQAAQERVRDPDAHEGVDKADDIAHGQRKPVERPGDMSSGGHPTLDD